MHAQLTVRNAKCDENKIGAVIFQLAAVDFEILMVRNLCDRYRILKDNSWMCILHQYYKTSRLKASTVMCREGEENGVNIISLIQDGSAQYTTFFS